MEILDVTLPNGETMPAGAIGADTSIEAISGFACLIEYQGEAARAIVCRRFEAIGGQHYVGAICSTARGYRQFRCDRITTVSDIATGETLGDGSYFRRFEVERERAVADTWGLSRSQHDHLTAGLNILAFMAHCDGHWHPLEEEVVEDFVCTLWMRKDWPGEPPLDRIAAHARRLSPDADIFGAALRNFAASATSARLLERFIGKVVAADGCITDEEHNWCVYFQSLVRDFEARAA